MTGEQKIYVAGHEGMVGSAIVRALVATGETDIVAASHEELDLTNPAAVESFVGAARPTRIVVAAARVGGIHANNSYPAEFIRQNLLIETNLIHAAHIHGCQRLLFLGSSCIYPRNAPQPIREEYLLDGQLEPTNEPYAIAKIAGIKLCESYNRQYGCDFLSLMPTNLYGPGDRFDSEDSHVIPALMSRLHKARVTGAPSVEIWGSGNQRREFLHVDDLAQACLHVLDLSADQLGQISSTRCSHVNVGTGVDMTIAELARLISEVVGYPGKLLFDTDRPDGMPRKRLDVSRLTSTGWSPTIALRDGLQTTYEWFVANARV